MSRLSHCETIAISASVQARLDETQRMESTLRAIAERNDDIESVAIRRANGMLIAEIGDHRSNWDNAVALRGSNTFVVVPVTASNYEPWGSIEVRFTDLSRSGLAWLTGHPCFRLLVAFPAAIFLCTYLYLRKMLRHMDPSKAVPSRVRSALDTVAGGLLVLDPKGQIVMVNRSFALSSGYTREELQGKKVADLPWTNPDPAMKSIPYDWLQAISEENPQPSVALSLGEISPTTFLVNCARIDDDEGKVRGILASFDDVTQLKKNEKELNRMLDELTKSREEIRRHNEQLHELAMQDPLTGCMNRRAFFERMEQEWSRAGRYNHPLSFVILDLDHFKLINDNHGHATGDTVLKKVAKVLIDTVRDGDFVCRYGGEEFCIGLPHIDVESAMIAADRFRNEIARSVEVDGRPVTASLGVSALSLGPEHPQAMVDQADKALYVAKGAGRNRVVCFADVPDDIEVDSSRIESVPTTAADPDVAIPFHAVTALTSALGYRDPMTADHSRRVADLCVATGSRLMSISECYILEIAALLHDIGKIGVPDAILLKPGSLTDKEWEVMEVHDLMGVEIVDSAFNSPELTEIIHTHHAFFGGTSRHDNLPKGKDIPLGARILSIADTYDAIVSDRVYRKGRTPEEAFAELRRCGGEQFDPEIVEHFIATTQSLGNARIDEHGEINKKVALRIGTQIERIGKAIDTNDRNALHVLLGRLKTTARAGEVHEIADAVAELEQLVGDGAETSQLLAMTNELLNLCRSTQRVFLDRQTESESESDSVAESESVSESEPASEV
ncbi:MAG: diguanylate cyclase [Pirellulaceae bacterium]|nr:diguanylate cyclase [Pirellulaceae bacterium]